MKKDYSILGYIFVVIGMFLFIKNLFTSRTTAYNSILPVMSILLGAFLIYSYINITKNNIALLLGLFLAINGFIFILSNIFLHTLRSYTFSLIFLSLAISSFIVCSIERRYYKFSNMPIIFLIISVISAVIILAKNILLSIKLTALSPLIFLAIGCFILYKCRLVK